MSALSGINNKGEKNQKGKYTSLNLNSTYRGTSVVATKQPVVARQHGLQSLGKVSARRMPPPINLPSLKSEHSGNNPSVNLVPTGGSGWGSKEEERKAMSAGGSVTTSSAAPTSSQQSQPTKPSTQHAAIPSNRIVPANLGNVVTSKPDHTKQTANVSEESNGSKSWSSITGGKSQRQSGFHNQQSPFFQEEFPTLSGGEKSNAPKKEEDKDQQYGPGPSLRPQNVGSWRDGGGRAVPAEESSDAGSGTTNTETPSSGSEIPPHSPDSHPGAGPHGGPHGGPMPGMRPGMHMPPHMATMMHPQFRTMMNPYMYNRPGFAPYPHPGMPRPYPYPDPRFHGSSHMGPGSQGGPFMGGRPRNDSDSYRSAIVKDEDIQEMDKFTRKQSDSHDDGWAGAQAEVDFSEKLVFSDEEDSGKSRRNEKRSEAQDESSSTDGHPEKPHADKQISPRDAWYPNPNMPYQRPTMEQRQWHQRMTFDPRVPYPFRLGPPTGQRHAYGPPATMGHGNLPGPPSSGGNSSSSNLPPGTTSPGVAVSSPPMAKSPPTAPVKTHTTPIQPEEEDDEWNSRRRQQNEEMTAAIERARQRREEEERKMEADRKAAADEKLKKLEQKMAATKISDDKEPESVSTSRSRGVSESSDKERKGQSQFNRPYKHVPPRFQKQQAAQQESHNRPDSQHSQRSVSPTSANQAPGSAMMWHPQMAGGPYDHRNTRQWHAGPTFMQRPPIDPNAGLPMHPPAMRKPRTDSGSDSHDSERKAQDDGRKGWAEHRGVPQYMNNSWEEQMRMGGPHHPGQYYEGGYMDYDRREFEKMEYEQSQFDHHEGNQYTEVDRGIREFKRSTSRDSEGSRGKDDRLKDKRDRHDRRDEHKEDSHKEQSGWDDMHYRREESHEERTKDDHRESNRKDNKVVDDRRRYDSHGSKDSVHSRGSRESLDLNRFGGSKESRVRDHHTSAGSGKNDDSYHRHSSRNDPPRDTMEHQDDWEDAAAKNTAPFASQTYNRSSKSDKDWASSPRSSGPVPITANQARKNMPLKDEKSFTALKRSHSNANAQPLTNKSDSSQKPSKVLHSDKFGKDKDVNDKSEQKGFGKFHDESRHDKMSRSKFEDKSSRSTKSDKDRKSGNKDDSMKNDPPKAAKPDAWNTSSTTPWTIPDRNDSWESSLPWEPEPLIKSEDRSNKEKREEERPTKRKKEDDRRDRDPRRRDERVRRGDRRSSGSNREYVRGGGTSRGRGSFSARGTGRGRGWDPHQKPSMRSFEFGTYDSKDSAPGQSQNQRKFTNQHFGDEVSHDEPVDGTLNSPSNDQWFNDATPTVNSDNSAANTMGEFRSKPDRQKKFGDDRRPSNRKESSSAFERRTEYKKDWTVGEGGKDYYTADRSDKRGENRRGRGTSRGRGSRLSSAPGRTGAGFNGRPRSDGERSHSSANDGDYRKGKTRNDKLKWDRTPSAPRFARGGRDGTVGRSDRGYDDRVGSGRGRGRGTSSGASNNTAPSKKPQLTKQNSSDLATEEWETASENSEKYDTKDEFNDASPVSNNNNSDEKRETKKSFSSQRPSAQNRRANSNEKFRSDRNSANGTGSRSNRNSSSGRPVNSNKKENVQNVYRVDQVVHNDPNAISKALTKTRKKGDITEGGGKIKERKTEALSNIDLNNYARVVVIDDQPEVSTIDEAYLYDSNEGFQEVKSKNRKARQRQEEAHQRKMDALKEKRDKKEQQSKRERRRETTNETWRSKLPPRFTKQHTQKEKKEPTGVSSFDNMAKIESWDNTMANDIPQNKGPISHAAKRTSSASPVTSHNTVSSSTVGVPVPAPQPTTNAWDKPINITAMTSTSTSAPSQPESAAKLSTNTNLPPQQATVPAQTDTNSKYMKNDQHDSGIEISEHHESTGSSTRSSPSTEQKIRNDSMNPKLEKKPQINEPPKPQRPAKNRGNKTNETGSTVPKPQINKDSKNTHVNPIQLPPSFDEAFKYDKGDDAPLPYVFEQSVANLTEDKAESKVINHSSKPLMTEQQSSTIISASGTDDLNKKITSVKNIWANATDYGLGVPPPSGNAPVSCSSQTSGSAATTIVSSNSQPFSSFSTASSMSQNITQSLPDPSNLDLKKVGIQTSTENSSSPVPNKGPSVNISEVINSNKPLFDDVSSLVSSVGISGNSSVSMPTYMDTDININKVLMSGSSEQSNVCKVKPQLQSHATASATQTVAHVQQSNPIPQPSPQQQAGLVAAPVPITPTSPQAMAQQPILLAPASQPVSQTTSSGSMTTSPPAPQSYIIAAPPPVSHYQPTVYGSSQMMEQRFPTQNYGLSQQTGGTTPTATLVQPPFNQHNLFLPSGHSGAPPGSQQGPSQNDLYQTSQTQPPQSFRNPFAAQPNPAAIMVATTSSSIMPSTVNKPQSLPQTAAYVGSQKGSQQGLVPGTALQYGQIVSGVPPSPMILYDHNQQGPSASAAANPTQNLQSSAQIIGSQLLPQQRTGQVQNMTVQPSPQSSFYSHQTPLQQTGFYQAQQASSSVQPSASPAGPFSIQGSTVAGSLQGSLPGSLQNIVQSSMLGTLPGSAGLQPSLPTNLPSSIQGVPAFNTPSQGMNVFSSLCQSVGQQAIQPSSSQPHSQTPPVNIGTQSTLNKSALPFKPAAARGMSNMKSADNNFGNASGLTGNNQANKYSNNSGNPSMGNLDLSSSCPASSLGPHMSAMSSADNLLTSGSHLNSYHSYNSSVSSINSSLNSSTSHNTLTSNINDSLAQAVSGSLTITTASVHGSISHSVPSGNSNMNNPPPMNALPPSMLSGMPPKSHSVPPPHMSNLSSSIHSSTSGQQKNTGNQQGSMNTMADTQNTFKRTNNQPSQYNQSYAQGPPGQNNMGNSNFSQMSVGLGSSTYGNQSNRSNVFGQKHTGPNTQSGPLPGHTGPPSHVPPPSLNNKVPMNTNNQFNQPPPSQKGNVRPNFNKPYLPGNMGQMMNRPPPLMGMQTSGPSNNAAAPNRFGSRPTHLPTNLPNTSGPPPPLNNKRPQSGPQSKSQPMLAGASRQSNSFKEQQAKQRADLIAHAANFLNPTKKEEEAAASKNTATSNATTPTSSTISTVDRNTTPTSSTNTSLSDSTATNTNVTTCTTTTPSTTSTNSS